MASFHMVRVRVSWTALLALAHFIYLLAGATIFRILEREAENYNRNHFLMEKLNFLANYTCLDGDALEYFVKVWHLLHCQHVFDSPNFTNTVMARQQQGNSKCFTLKDKRYSCKMSNIKKNVTASR